MALSRATRISILLVVDILFFIVEITVGYIIGSLALVADSFHMLNDVLSLLIALYAIRLSSKPSDNARLSYGWNRAEILAALINGVFLLALCFSIALEAIERFVQPPVISHPRLIVTVGCLGFLASVLGMFLFRESDSQEGTTKHNHGPSPQNVAATDTTLNLPPLSPSNADFKDDLHSPPFRPPSLPSSPDHHHIDPITETHRAATDNALPFPSSHEKHLNPVRRSGLRETDSWIPPLRRLSYSSLYGYPPATRAILIQAAHDISSRTTSIYEEPPIEVDRAGDASSVNEAPVVPSSIHARPLSVASSIPSTSYPTHKPPSSGAMNMRSIFLHVMGDALGNLGVVVSGLVIWFAKGKFRFYLDPLVSLLLTAIIFSSALPLVRSTSYILLQGVPCSIDVAYVERAILAIDGVQSLHELHVWQLSETKLVASVHVAMFRTHDFMTVALKIPDWIGERRTRKVEELLHLSDSVPVRSEMRSVETLVLPTCSGSLITLSKQIPLISVSLRFLSAVSRLAHHPFSKCYPFVVFRPCVTCKHRK